MTSDDWNISISLLIIDIVSTNGDRRYNTTAHHMVGVTWHESFVSTPLQWRPVLELTDHIAGGNWNV